MLVELEHYLLLRPCAGELYSSVAGSLLALFLYIIITFFYRSAVKLRPLWATGPIRATSPASPLRELRTKLALALCCWTHPPGETGAWLFTALSFRLLTIPSNLPMGMLITLTYGSYRQMFSLRITADYVLRPFSSVSLNQSESLKLKSLSQDALQIFVHTSIERSSYGSTAHILNYVA